jgi:hypothetical protein
LDYYNRNQLGEIFVDVTDMPMDDLVVIKFARYINGVKHCANFVKGPRGVTVLQWEQVQEGTVIPDHCKLQLPKDTARFLMEGFKKILDHQYRPNRSLEEAYQKHIKDLRTVAFHQMGVKDEEPAAKS